jgi:hypothetical protein
MTERGGSCLKLRILGSRRTRGHDTTAESTLVADTRANESVESHQFVSGAPRAIVIELK